MNSVLYRLNSSYLGVDCIDFNEQDPNLQETFANLSEENFSKGLGYLIAILLDEVGQVSIQDACSFWTGYNFYKLKTSSLTRAKIIQGAFYRVDADNPSKIMRVCELADLKRIDRKKPKPTDKKLWRCYLSAYDYRFSSKNFSDKQNTAVTGEAQFQIAQVYDTKCPFIEISDRARNYFFKNDHKAFHWYQHSAKGNHVHAWFRLSILLQSGRGCEASSEEAFKYNKLAYEAMLLSFDDKIHIETKNRIAQSMHKRYLEGIGTPVDEKQAQIVSESLRN